MPCQAMYCGRDSSIHLGGGARPATADRRSSCGRPRLARTLGFFGSFGSWLSPPFPPPSRRGRLLVARLMIKDRQTGRCSGRQTRQNVPWHSVARNTLLHHSSGVVAVNTLLHVLIQYCRAHTLDTCCPLPLLHELRAHQTTVLGWGRALHAGNQGSPVTSWGRCGRAQHPR